MNLLEELREQALKTYKGDQEQADQFVNGFITKAASIWDTLGIDKNRRFRDTFDLTKEQGKGSFGGAIAKGVGESLGRAAVGGAASVAVAGIGAVAGAIRDHRLYNKFLAALNEAVRSNPVLNKADRNNIINLANTIFKFAPHVASDPNLLGHALANAIHSELLDTKTINDLVQLESKYREMGSFEPKKWL